MKTNLIHCENVSGFPTSSVGGKTASVKVEIILKEHKKALSHNQLLKIR